MAAHAIIRHGRSRTWSVATSASVRRSTSRSSTSAKKSGAVLRDRPLFYALLPRPMLPGSGDAELQRAVAFVDPYGRSVLDVAAQDQVRERILQIALHRTLERPRAIDRIVPDPAEPR